MSRTSPSRNDPSLRRWRRLALLALLLPAGAVSAQVLAPGTSAASLMDALEAAWGAQDVDRYLGLWSFADDDAREAEREFARVAFDTGAGGLLLERPPAAAGEDYCLLLAADPGGVEALAAGFAAAFGLPLAVIGGITDEPEAVRYERAGREAILHGHGFDHFAADGGS